MATLTDTGGIAPEDTLNAEQSGETPPMPSVPDFARIIPITTIQQAKQQQMADEWGQQQQQKIASLWGTFAQDQLDQTVQRNTTVQWGAPQPTAYEPMAQPTVPAPDVNPVTAEPAQNPIIDQLMQGLGGLVGKLQGAVQGPPAGQPPSPEERGAAIEAARPADMPALTGQDVLNGAGQGLQAWQQAGAEHQLAAAQALDPNAQPEDVEALNKIGGDVTGIMMPGASGVPGRLAAAAEKGVAGVAREALTADHPLVQQAAAATRGNVVDGVERTVSADAVAKAIQAKNFDPEALAKASGRLTPTQTAALAAWKASQDPEIAAALEKSAAPEANVAISAGPSARDMPTPSSSEPSVENLANSGHAELPSEGSPYTGAGESVLANTPVAKGLNAVQGILKQAVLAGSIFHPIVEAAQLGRTALASGRPIAGIKAIGTSARSLVDSGFAERWAKDNAAAIARGEDAGGTMLRVGGPVNSDVQQVGNRIARTLLSSTGSGVAGYASGKAQGESDADALKRAAIFAAGGAGVAQFAPTLNQAMWGRMVPVAKTEAFKMLEPQYGAEVAAKRVNDTFGGQNLAKLGRNPELQTVLRSTFLAPDWLESWARNMGAVVKPGPEGDAARKYWAATGVSSALTLEGMNMAINGHPTTDNEPGRQLQLEVTPLVRAMGGDPKQRYYADVLELGPLGSVLNAANRGGIGAVGQNLAAGHLNVVPDIALQAIQNRAPTGGQIVSPGTPAAQAALPEIAAAAGHVAPIGASTFEKSNIPVPVGAGSALTGVRVAAGPAGTQPKGAVNPMAPSGAVRGGNVGNLRSFLSGPSSKGSNPMAPRGGTNLSNLRAALK